MKNDRLKSEEEQRTEIAEDGTVVLADLDKVVDEVISDQVKMKLAEGKKRGVDFYFSDKNRGFNQHKRTQLIANVSRAMAGYGSSPKEIADVLGMEERTIVKFYGREMQEGQSIYKAQVRKKIYDLCMEGDKSLLQLFAKTQLGWSETKKVEQNIQISLSKEQRDAMARAAQMRFVEGIE